MRLLCGLMLCLFSSLSFGATSHSCTQVLDFSEADKPTQELIKEHTLGFFNWIHGRSGRKYRT